MTHDRATASGRETIEAPDGPELFEPLVIAKDADCRFRALVAQMGQNPADPWIDGYVAYEWARARHVLASGEGSLEGKRVLEFGCNYGATSVVLASMGARVDGVDISEPLIAAARENLLRYGVGAAVDLRTYDVASGLAYADSTFDIAVCNSVLEYVDPQALADVQREIDRVLKDGGRIYVMGTSNRLAAREVHSGRWFSNYVPRVFDQRGRMRARQRGVAPWAIRNGHWKDYENLDWIDKGAAYLRARRAFPDPRPRTLRVLNEIARCFKISLGLLTPSISMTLRKRGNPQRPTGEAR